MPRWNLYATIKYSQMNPGVGGAMLRKYAPTGIRTRTTGLEGRNHNH